ncbi:MAG: hypothetical protein AAB439_02800 [Patescibacteria group bacterium]
MEIEELTKSQIILLVLLVSFVTSIATGIVTVSLLAQAPPAITQTVNRVIERTVETVVPAENQTAAVVTKETTVVVKEDDLITQSITNSFGIVARIHETTSTSSPILALGAVVGQGTLVTDASMVSGEHAVVIGGDTFRFVVSAKIPEAGIALLTATGTVPSVSSFKSVDAGSIKLGQTLIGLYGARSDRVAMSTLSGVGELVKVGKGDAASSVRALATTVDATLTPGTPLITIFGELAGISTNVSRSDSRGSFVAYSDIASYLSKPVAPTATTTPQ